MSQITDAKEYFIKLVASSVNQTAVHEYDERIDFHLLFRLACRNSSQAMLYYALLLKRQVIGEENFSKLEKSYKALMIREFNQQSEIEAIRSEFSRAGIDFMLLKGTHLKALYPKPEMRFMVDMDVLVKQKDVKQAGEIILSHGLQQEMNNGKDIVYIKKPFLTIELHNSLFVEDYHMYDYFCDVWEKAEKVSEHEYKMSVNDLYVYTMAHLTEHYTAAGSCFRPTIDIYLMNRNYSEQLDFDYIDKQFEKLKLKDFADNIKELGLCWFEGHEKNENLTVMENFIVFGAPVKNASVLSKVTEKKKSKFSLLFLSAFPGLRHMQCLFPLLIKYPFLIPVFWVARLFKHLFTKETMQRINTISSTDMKDAEVLKDIYKKSGL